MHKDHNYYVQIIFDYIIKSYSNKKFYFNSDLEIHDNVERIPIPNPAKPPPELIKVPDLVAQERNNHHFTILGEAKTYNDFFKDRNRVNTQLDYYFNRLKYKNNGMLIYSLPHSLKNNVTNLIIEKKEEWNASTVNFLVITDLDYSELLI